MNILVALLVAVRAVSIHLKLTILHFHLRQYVIFFLYVQRTQILETASYHKWTCCVNCQCQMVKSNDIAENSEILCQFILEPCSINLPQRISVQDPLLDTFFKLSRQLCYLINGKRMKLLQSWYNVPYIIKRHGELRMGPCQFQTHSFAYRWVTNQSPQKSLPIFWTKV